MPQRERKTWERNNAHKYRVFPIAKTWFLGLITFSLMKKAASKKRLFMKPAQAEVRSTLYQNVWRMPTP